MALSKLTAELYALYDNQQYDKCQQLLPPIQVELIKTNLFVPLAQNTASADSTNDLKVLQRIFEIGALLALLTNAYPQFENFFAQLRPFYQLRALHGPEKDTETTKIISLWLLYLLLQGWTLRFHVELELLVNSPLYDIGADRYLQFPIALERHLMEGNYIKIWRLLHAEDQACPEYTRFIGTLTHALRLEIAKLIDKTYTSLPVSNAKNMLYFPQEMGTLQFEQALRDDLGVSWRFDGLTIVIDRTEPADDLAGPAAVVNNVLNYADQIESIV